MRNLRRVVIGLTILYWGTLFSATHVPAPRLPVMTVTDKTLHFSGYALLAVAVFCTLRLAKPGWRDLAATVLAICLTYAAVDEWTQALPFIGRACELADWYADAAGAAVGVLLCSIVMYLARQAQNNLA
jgi:VanZ family protein